MFEGFRSFLVKQNILTLAIAVVIGTALNSLVKAVVEGFIMPVVFVFSPAGAWMTLTWAVGPLKFGIGIFLAALLNFLIVGFIAWRVTKALEHPASVVPARICNYCQSEISAKARRCPHCTSTIFPK